MDSIGSWLGVNQPSSGNIGSGWSQGGNYGGYEGAMTRASAPTFTPTPAPSAGGLSFGNLGGMGKTLLPLGALVASNYVQGRQAQKTAQNAANQNQQIAQNAASQNQQIWQQNAYPRQAAVQAAAKENRGELGQARMSAYQNMASNLAARGWGSGSGLGRAGAANIEKGYLQALGKQATDMTKFANTPMFGMPSNAYVNPQYVTPVSGGTESALSGMDTALGYYMMSRMLGG